MKEAFTIVSAAAGAIVALIKVVGELTGSRWLGDNWKEALAAYAILYVSFWAVLMFWLIWHPLPGAAWAKPGLSTLGRIREYAFQVLRVALFVALVVWMASQWNEAATNPLWFIGALGLFTTLLYGLVWGSEAHKKAARKRAKCPLCRETVHVQAVRCKHCLGHIEPRVTRIILPPGVDP